MLVRSRILVCVGGCVFACRNLATGGWIFVWGLHGRLFVLRQGLVRRLGARLRGAVLPECHALYCRKAHNVDWAVLLAVVERTTALLD